MTRKSTLIRPGESFTYTEIQRSKKPTPKGTVACFLSLLLHSLESPEPPLTGRMVRLTRHSGDSHPYLELTLERCTMIGGIYF